MFEKLQEERRGAKVKERRRLIVTIAAVLATGTIVLGGHYGCTVGSGEQRRDATGVDEASGTSPKDTSAELDRAPLQAFLERGEVLNDFEASTLDYVARAVLRGDFSRDAWKRMSPAEVAALDPKEAVGRTIQVRGVVKDLDREARQVTESKDLLWAFTLEGEDGSKIVVVHPGEGRILGERRPELSPKGASKAFENGLAVEVKGVYLQRRTGTIAGVVLGQPTVVLFGREYRAAIEAKPPPKSLSDIDFDTVEDRFEEEMREVQGPYSPAWQVIQWAQAVGHDEIARRIKSGELESEPWAAAEFLAWRTEMAAERRKSDPDRRKWIPERRGKVVRTWGITGEWIKEEWDQIPENDRDVLRRWKLWVLSHWDGFSSIRFDSPFPPSAFAGVLGHRRERLKVYGVFIQTYSFHVQSPEAQGKEAPRKGWVQSPYFVLLHVEPDPLPPSAPLFENPFFWTWVSLAVFGLVFFAVMSRVEKRESAAARDQGLRIRRRVRATDKPGGAGPSSPPATPSPGGDPAPKPEPEPPRTEGPS